jgi:hypothetical protein
MDGGYIMYDAMLGILLIHAISAVRNVLLMPIN